MKLKSLTVNTGFLLLLGFLPVQMRIFFGATSMALGLLSWTILLLILNFKNIKRLQYINIYVLILTYIFLLFLSFQLLMIPNGSFGIKFFISFVLLLFFVASSSFFSKSFLQLNDQEITILLSRVFYSLILLGYFAGFTNFWLSIHIFNQPKSIFPFGEPSHFALFIGPFLIALFTLTQKLTLRLWIFFLMLGLSLLIQSTTSIIYLFMISLLYCNFSVRTFLIVIPLGIISAFFVLQSDYYLSRFILSKSSSNLTALVYLQGLEDALYGLTNTSGLGLGFQNLGSQPPSEAFYQILNILNQDVQGVGLNRKDGGFLAAKIIAELGFFGIIVICIYLNFLFRSFFCLRKIILKGNIYPAVYVFALAGIYSSSVEMFVRGMGYFTPSLFIFFTSLFIFSYFGRHI